jgi:hypothetical protein
MVVGMVKPVIVLPLGLMAQLSRAELEAVLYHELGHVLRRDFLWGLVQQVVETVFFYHPLVWWLGRRMREERELCCDDLAVSMTGAPLVFAKALARVGELSLTGPRVVPAATGGSLRKRIRRLVEGEAGGRGLDGFAMIPALLLVVSVVSGMLAIHQPAVDVPEDGLSAVAMEEAARIGEQRALEEAIAERARSKELEEQIAVQRREIAALRMAAVRLDSERERVRRLRNDLAARERELVLAHERARSVDEARRRLTARELARHGEALAQREEVLSRAVESETGINSRR